MKNNVFETAKRTLVIESDAVKDQIKHLNKDFLLAVDILAKCLGRVVVMGVGKSGLVGRKIAATMSSLGVPAMFSHPAECLHGDIGMLMREDVVLFLSYSGETDEIKKVLPAIKNLGIKILVMSGRTNASLWKQADIIINTKIKREACPYNLAPTSSTTAMLAMGDALALSASEKKGFKKETLASFHPEGGLGKKLTIRVKDIMRKGNRNPVIGENCSVHEALLVMTETRLGATSIINKQGKLVGFFTDGDLRRKLQDDKALLNKNIKQIMTTSPLTILPDMMAVDAAKILKKRKFDNIPVVDKSGKPVGIIDEGDLFAEGIV